MLLLNCPIKGLPSDFLISLPIQKDKSTVHALTNQSVNALLVIDFQGNLLNHSSVIHIDTTNK